MVSKRKRGVIFDLDGTLVDSRLDFKAMRRDLNIPPEAEILETIAAVSDATERRRLESIVLSHEIAGANCARPFPGAHQLLESLTKNGVRVAIFTRNARSVAEMTLARVGFDIQLIVAREDAPPKPNPAGLHLILSRWNVQPQDALFVGDYLFDLQAGRQAKIPTLLFAPTPPDFIHNHQEIISSLCEVEEYL